MSVSTLGEYLHGKKDKESHGIHIIWTPDTAFIANDTINHINKLLLLRDDTRGQEEVTYEELSEYGSFKDGTMINDLGKRVRGKHTYYISDPHGDFNSIRKLERKILDILLPISNDGNLSTESVLALIKEEIKPLFQDALSLNDKLVHDISMLEAIKSNGAESTNLVMAAIAYARQDKPTDKRREPHTFKLLWEWISSLTGNKGYVINIDLHNPAMESAFKDTQLINLYTGWFIEECMKKIGVDLENFKISGADQGGDKKIVGIARDKGLSHVTVIKARDYSKRNSVGDIKFLGDITDKDILIHDDIADSCGTLCGLLKEMLKYNPKSINIAITHGMFHGDAYDKLDDIIKRSNGIIKKVYTTNSIYKEDLPGYIEQINMSHLLANTILGIHTRQGVDRDDNTDYTRTT